MSDGKFQKGHTPWHKGRKVQTNTGRTHFKKGMRPWNKDTKGVMKSWNKGTVRYKSHECLTCMRRFRVPEYYPSKGKYCSRKCSGLARMGENNHNWVGGGWLYVRKQVLLDKDFTCENCGLRDTEIMEVNHKIERSRHPELARDRENLEVLCPNCHRRKTNAFLRAKKG